MQTASADRVYDDSLDVIVVGAGQAGLAAGFYLARTQMSFRLFDRAARVGESWRRRHDSLTLFSPRAYSCLPGLAMPGAPDRYPGKDETADYLERYAHVVRLPVSLREGIAELARSAGMFVARTDASRSIAARAVIVADGAFQHSVVPAFASRLSARVQQIPADQYRNAKQISFGRVLVVGGGSTGRQIAYELALGRDVSLSVGRSPSITPQRILGRDVMEWFDALGLLRADKATLHGRLARTHESFPGLHLRDGALRDRGVHILRRTVAANDDVCRVEDGAAGSYDVVVWALGYRDDTAWLRIDGAVDGLGRRVEERGISPVPGLFYVGRNWQTSRASALLCGVGDDAARVVGCVEHWLIHTQSDCCQRGGDERPTAVGQPPAGPGRHGPQA